jgi:hypothetical protein
VPCTATFGQIPANDFDLYSQSAHETSGCLQGITCPVQVAHADNRLPARDCVLLIFVCSRLLFFMSNASAAWKQFFTALSFENKKPR